MKSWTKLLVIAGLVSGWVVLSPPSIRQAYSDVTYEIDAQPRGRVGKKVKQQTSSKRPTVGVVNINTATAAEIMRLPGIGPAKAERIVAYRKRRGRFQRTKDIRRVKGIGYKTWKRLEPMLRISGPTTLAK